MQCSPDGAIAWHAPDQATLALGVWQGRWRYASVVSDVPDQPDWRSVRRCATQWSPAEADLAGMAMALAHFAHSHRFCPRCGSALQALPGGRQRNCPEGHQFFPRLDPAVIMAVYDDHGRLLLGRQSTWPEGMMSVLAGFVDAGETPEDAVRREVMEEVGIDVDTPHYIGAQPWPFPQSLMLGYAVRARNTVLTIDHAEIEHADWFDRETLQRAASAQDCALHLSNPASISRRLIDYWRYHPEAFPCPSA